MVLPDLHIPHHDEEALEVVMRVHRLIRPEETVILGDWLDCAAFSSHAQASLAEERAHDFLADEIEPCNELLDRLERNTKRLVFIAGNHEHRVERACLRLGREMQAVADLISPQRLLSRGRRRFTYIPYTDVLARYEITPDLWALHGWSHAKNAAREVLGAAMGRSVVYGHTHRAQMETSRDPGSNRVIKAWSPGCLAQLQPFYSHSRPTTHTHGFSIIFVNRERTSWTAYSPTIQQGSCVLPSGKIIRV